MSGLRAVVFDRDGVLTRFDLAPVVELFRGVPRASFEDLWRRWHEYYTARPLPRTRDEERVFLDRFWATICEAWDLDEGMYTKLCAFDYTRTIHAFDDARPALLAVRERGLRVGVLSNFPLVSLEESLIATNLRSLVDVAIAAAPSGAPKPDRRAYEAMLDALDVQPSECLFVDDEVPCVEGARVLGLRAYLLDRNGSSPARANVIHGLDQIADLIAHEEAEV